MWGPRRCSSENDHGPASAGLVEQQPRRRDHPARVHRRSDLDLAVSLAALGRLLGRLVRLGARFAEHQPLESDQQLGPLACMALRARAQAKRRKVKSKKKKKKTRNKKRRRRRNVRPA